METHTFPVLCSPSLARKASRPSKRSALDTTRSLPRTANPARANRLRDRWRTCPNHDHVVHVKSAMLRSKSRVASVGCGAGRAPGDRPDVGEHATGVPGREGLYQPPEPLESDAVLAGGLGPGELAGVPFDEGFGFRRDAEVLIEAGRRPAALGVSALDEEPVTLPAGTSAELEADHDASIREPVSAERVAHRPQGHEGIEVLGSDLEPARAPLAERPADGEQVVARDRELVVVPAPAGLGRRLDHSEPLELPESLGEQGAGESGRALQDLAEARTAKVQVADDQRGPALGEDLGAAGDGTVLAVGPHQASVAHPPSAVKSRFLTLRLRFLVLRCRRREREDPMTTPADRGQELILWHITVWQCSPPCGHAAATSRLSKYRASARMPSRRSSAPGRECRGRGSSRSA